MKNNNNPVTKLFGAINWIAPALFLCFTLLSTGVYANSIQITPLRAEVSNSDKNAIFDVINPTEYELAVQLQAVAWTQEGSREIYTKTNDVLAVPVLFKIPPGEKQTIRAALMRPNLTDQEKQYRLIFTEIPTPEKLKAAAGDSKNLRLNMRLQFNLPIFAMPQNKVSPKLEFEGLTQEEAKKSTLKFSNYGSQHVRISTIKYIDLSGNETEEKMANYLLPNTTKTIKPQNADLNLIKKIVVITDTAGELQYEIS